MEPGGEKHEERPQFPSPDFCGIVRGKLGKNEDWGPEVNRLSTLDIDGTSVNEHVEDEQWLCDGDDL